MPAAVATPPRIVVLASGAGTLLQQLIDVEPEAPWTIAAVGSDRRSCPALDRADAVGVPTFRVVLADYPDRAAWDRALAQRCRAADLIVSAGFLKLVGPEFLAEHGGRMINSHPSLLPSFPGMHAPQDALDYGVTVTGCSIFLVDGGVDAGPIVAQRAVAVERDDDADTLHERIKRAERLLLVEVVTRMTTGGWQVQGRKVLLGG